MKNVLVLGSAGMAGHAVTLTLNKNKDLNTYNVSHSRKLNNQSTNMDVMELEKFDRFLNTLQLDVVINCTGILNEFAEKFKDKAAFINGYLPHFLETKYEGTGTKVIHLSTDCVFSGRGGGYDEHSCKDGDSFYARTKAVGELVNGKDLTIRTSIIGPDINMGGIGLFNWYMKSKNQINGYINHLWTGVTTIELAKAVEAAISENLSGLYHLVPPDKINKYDLLILLNHKFNRKDLSICRFENSFIDRSLINTRSDFTYKVPGYEQMAEEIKIWIDEHVELYPHYMEVMG